MSEKYTVFIIQAYERLDSLGNMDDVVTLELIADNKEEALAKAKKLVKKAGYRLARITELFKPINSKT